MHASIFYDEKSYHVNTMSIWRYHVDLQTFSGIFKKQYIQKKYTVATCVRQTMATSDQISYSSLFFHQKWRLSTRFPIEINMI